LNKHLFWLIELAPVAPCQYLGVIKRGDGMVAFGWTGWDRALRLSRRDDAEALLNQLRQWDWFGLTLESKVTEHIDTDTDRAGDGSEGA
jgi:hypothetical protein